jgi:hypothetical protein
VPERVGAGAQPEADRGSGLSALETPLSLELRQHRGAMSSAEVLRKRAEQ